MSLQPRKRTAELSHEALLAASLRLRPLDQHVFEPNRYTHIRETDHIFDPDRHIESPEPEHMFDLNRHATKLQSYRKAGYKKAKADAYEELTQALTEAQWSQIGNASALSKHGAAEDLVQKLNENAELIRSQISNMQRHHSNIKAASLAASTFSEQFSR